MKVHCEAIVNAVQACLPQAKNGTIALSEPCLQGNEWHYVKDCLDTGWVSSVGHYVERFERMLEDLTGAKHAIATVNGTAALHICLTLAGVERGHEVLVPALTYVATSNAVAYCGAIPHFVDSHSATLGVDADALELYLKDITRLKNGVCHNRYTDRVIKALLVMHTFGHAVDLDLIQDLCNRYHLLLLEDAAEAVGTLYKNQHVGHYGLLGALSFNGNKIVTTGGGGAILCDQAPLAEQARHLIRNAKIPHPWKLEHDRIGYNYGLPNINAALGCAQLEQLPTLLRAKRQLASRYQARLEPVAGIAFIRENPMSTSNYWLNGVLLDRDCAEDKEALIQRFHHRGIMVRPAWTLQNKLPMYRDCPSMATNTAEDLAARLINLPSSAGCLVNA